MNINRIGIGSVAKPSPDWFSRRHKGSEAHFAAQSRRERNGSNRFEAPKHTRPVHFEGPDGKPVLAWYNKV